MLFFSKSLANRLGQYGSTVTPAAFTSVWMLSPYIISLTLVTSMLGCTQEA